MSVITQAAMSRLPLIPAVVLFLLGPSAAWAQTASEKSAARSTAKAGILAYQEQDYDKAIDLLERAESVIHAPPHLLFLARAKEASGDLVGARETYLELIHERIGPDAPNAFGQAQEAARSEVEELEARVPRATINVDGAEREQIEVWIAGEPLPSIALGVATPINPGTNEIVATAPGMKEARTTVTVEEGGEAIVSITLEVANVQLEAASRATDSQVESVEERAPQGDPRRTWGYVVGGVGLATMGAGGVFGVWALSQASDARNDASLCPNERCTPRGDEKVEQAKTSAMISNLGLGAGAALVVVGTVLLLTSKQKSQEQVSALVVEPNFGPRAGGLSLRGSF